LFKKCLYKKYRKVLDENLETPELISFGKEMCVLYSNDTENVKVNSVKSKKVLFGLGRKGIYIVSGMFSPHCELIPKDCIRRAELTQNIGETNQYVNMLHLVVDKNEHRYYFMNGEERFWLDGLLNDNKI